MFKKDENMNITGISMYVIIIVFIIIFIWYIQPIIFPTEDYAPNRERTDPQSDWNIVEAIQKIKNMQRRYFSRFTQSPSYGF